MGAQGLRFRRPLVYPAPFCEPDLTFQVAGANTALIVDSRAVLPLGEGTRTVDVWLSAVAGVVLLYLWAR